MAAALPPLADAPESLGARCSADNCSYGNAYERRDVGLALVLPVFRKVVLREVHAHFSRELDGRWALDALSVGDVPPPNYGPLRIGADPTSS